MDVPDYLFAIHTYTLTYIEVHMYGSIDAGTGWTGERATYFSEQSREIVPR